MEILINELSLTKHFLSVNHFIKNALVPFIAVLKEIDSSKDVILKKQDFWNIKITNSANLHNILIQNSDETTHFKSILSNLIDEPYWDSFAKQKQSNNYEYNEKNICNSSLAESCERDKIVVSFLHDDFIQTSLHVKINEHQKVVIDNLFEKEHYTEVAFLRKQISESDYLKRKIEWGQISLLEDSSRFRKTNRIIQGKPIYEEISTKHYWYLDNLHKDHHEVFDNTGNHIGEADMRGRINYTKKDINKTIKL